MKLSDDMTKGQSPFKTATVFVAATFLLAACGEGSNTAETAKEEAPAVQSSSSTDAADTMAATDSSGENMQVQYSAGRTVDGVAYGELIMGNPAAPVTMIEYASMTCPHCAAFHNNTLPELKKKYIETGEVRLVYRNYIMNQWDLYASMVSRCVGPEKAFGMMSLFFNRQSVWLQDDILNNLASLARRAGMNRATFDQCLANKELQADLLAMRELGIADGLTGTPYFLINGTPINNGPIENFIEAIEDAK